MTNVTFGGRWDRAQVAGAQNGSRAWLGKAKLWLKCEVTSVLADSGQHFTGEQVDDARRSDCGLHQHPALGFRFYPADDH